MRTGDTVLHRPTGETWLVAFVEDGRLCACGWPLELVPAADCDIVKSCDNLEHNKLLVEMAEMQSDDPRRSYARRVLKREDQ